MTIIANVASRACAVEGRAVLVADAAVLAKIWQTIVDGILTVGSSGAWHAAVAVDTGEVGRTGAFKSFNATVSMCSHQKCSKSLTCVAVVEVGASAIDTWIAGTFI